MQSTRFSRQILAKLEFSRQILEKTLKYQLSRKIHLYRQKDTMKLPAALQNFAIGPKTQENNALVSAVQ